MAVKERSSQRHGVSGARGTWVESHSPKKTHAADGGFMPNAAQTVLAGGLNLNQFRRLDPKPGIQISPHLLQKGCKATPEDHESWNPAVSLNSPRTRPSLQLRRPGETSNARRPKNGQAKERDEPLQVVLVDPRRDILVDLVNLGTLWRSFRWGFMSNHFSGHPRS